MSSYFECQRCDFSCRTASSLRDHEHWGGCRREERASSIDGEENIVNVNLGDTDEEHVPVPPPEPMTPARQRKSRSPAKPPEVRVVKCGYGMYKFETDLTTANEEKKNYIYMDK